MRIAPSPVLLALALAACGSLAVPTRAAARPPDAMDAELRTIALGSCNRESLGQDYWSIIHAQSPDLWIWLGDNIYADTRDLAVMRAKYDRQFNAPAYRAFREAVPIVGTWDDHDYGQNDAGALYPMKVESQQCLLDFLEEPPDSARRTQAGVYAAYRFGPPGRRVKIILLDGRYHAGPAGGDGDLLGEAQWRFLERELTNDTAEVCLIGSGIQILPEDHRFEKWSRYPRSRERLLRLLRDHAVPGVVFLSGDRHLHEISLANDAATPYPLPELTSSGLTHTYTNFKGEPNRYRALPVLTEAGFGIIRFEWDAPQPAVCLEIHSMAAGKQRELRLPLAVLQPAKR